MPTSSATTDPGTSGWFFFRKFLKDHHNVASIWPSSQILARAMLRGLELRPGDTVVEYGPGTGSFTQALLSTAPKDIRFLAIERDPDFRDLLARRFPEHTFVQGLVQDVDKILEEKGFDPPKVVLSGLPLISFPRRDVDRILLQTQRLLAPGGSFRTFSYTHSMANPRQWSLRSRMARIFARYNASRPVWRNAPPALVLTGWK